MSEASLDLLLQDWRQLLRQWSRSGALHRAAREALQLSGPSNQLDRLDQLLDCWSRDDFRDLPPVQSLPGSSLPQAAGAYATELATIFLNADWLQRAPRDQALLVLTEELGHHLDALLHQRDTPGDEGALLAQLLSGTSPDPTELARLRAEDDGGACSGRAAGWRWSRPCCPNCRS